VIVVKITTVGVTVVPILPTFVGSGWMKCLLLAAINTAKTHGWLLWETMAIALIATIPLFMIGEHALLLSGGVAAACGLLANSHAELLSVCKLVLHCNQAVSLALHGFLHSSIHGTKVCKGVTLQHNQRVVLHSGHTLSMLRGHDSSLVDECNHVGQIFFEGVDCLNHWWDRVLTWDPIFVLLGVHSAALDDVQADVNEVVVVHWVACSAHVGSADEEVHCEGLKIAGPVENLSNFQMAPTPILSVWTCLNSSPLDILKVLRKIIDHNLLVGGTNVTIEFRVGLALGCSWIFYK
jgi:hypothetical protein